LNAYIYSNARTHLSEIMDRVCDDHDPTIITRHKKRPVVLVSQEDYEALIKRCSSGTEKR